MTYTELLALFNACHNTDVTLTYRNYETDLQFSIRACPDNLCRSWLYKIMCSMDNSDAVAAMLDKLDITYYRMNSLEFFCHEI